MSNDFKLTKEQKKIIDSLKNEKDKKSLTKNFQREYEWDHSLDGILYQLGTLHVSHAMEVCIVKTISKLPDKVKEFIYDNCQFTAISSDSGQTICMTTKQNRMRPWLIILSEENKEDYESVIAHEIAHAWLRHKGAPGEILPIEKCKSNELEACFFARQWGFVGSGTVIDKGFAEIEKMSKKESEVKQ